MYKLFRSKSGKLKVTVGDAGVSVEDLNPGDDDDEDSDVAAAKRARLITDQYLAGKYYFIIYKF